MNICFSEEFKKLFYTLSGSNHYVPFPQMCCGIRTVDVIVASPWAGPTGSTPTPTSSGLAASPSNDCAVFLERVLLFEAIQRNAVGQHVSP